MNLCGLVTYIHNFNVSCLLNVSGILMCCVISQDSAVEIAFIPGKGLFPSSTSLHNGIQRAAGNNYNSGRLKVHIRSPEVTTLCSGIVVCQRIGHYFRYFIFRLINMIFHCKCAKLPVEQLVTFILEISATLCQSVYLLMSSSPVTCHTVIVLTGFLCRSVQRSQLQCRLLPLTCARQISIFQVDQITPHLHALLSLFLQSKTN